MPLKVVLGIAWTVGILAILFAILAFHQSIPGF